MKRFSSVRYIVIAFLIAIECACNARNTTVSKPSGDRKSEDRAATRPAEAAAYVPRLILAITYGDERAARTLISEHDNVDERDFHGSTALYYASFGTVSIDIVKSLLNAGANPNAVCRNGLTPAFLAAESNRADILRLLIENGAKVDKVDDEGLTPLHWAALGGSLSCAALLVKNGAKINAETARGETPLDLSKDQAVTRFLIAHGAVHGKAMVK